MSVGKVLAGVLILAGAGAALASQPDGAVRIEGGTADSSGQNYAWKIQNGTSKPIVFVRFPHFWADTFVAPKGWTMNCTNLQQIGSKSIPGICEATAPPDGAIPPGGSAAFEMRLANKSPALRRRGTVGVRFADGTETTVSGVELPTQASFLERNIQGLAMVGIVAIVLAIAVIRKQRAAPREAADAAEEST